MEIYGEISKVRAAVKAWKKEGLTVGFVPTMGYLHEGHKSLIDAARKENDRVVVSIFETRCSSDQPKIWRVIRATSKKMLHCAKLQV